jgi:phospholipid/cholesterol/gamma-HCH transport system ATP-binding protein
LRKAACIRAFIGKPAFIIVEQPVRGLYADLMAPLLNAVQSARKRGAAVLWTVTDPDTWNHPGIFATTQARMFDSQLHVLEKEL